MTSNPLATRAEAGGGDEAVQLNLLVDLLTARTNEGKIDWQQTADEQLFIGGFGGGRTAEIGRWFNGYSLLVRSQNGTRIVDVEEPYAGAVPRTPDDPRLQLARGLEDLYRVARWKACDVEPNTGEVISVLECL